MSRCADAAQAAGAIVTAPLVESRLLRCVARSLAPTPVPGAVAWAVPCERRLFLCACLASASAVACVETYAEPEPPSLSADDIPTLDQSEGGDALVFERDLRWWQAPTVQRIRIYDRAEGGLLLLRQRWDGSATYAWATGELTAAGEQRLAEAEAAFDPSLTEPAAGSYECTYHDTLPAAVYVDAAAYPYASLCPPEGWAALAKLYEELGELLLDCPLDPSWYEGDALPLAQTDCQIAQ